MLDLNLLSSGHLLILVAIRCAITGYPHQDGLTITLTLSELVDQCVWYSGAIDCKHLH